MPRETPPADESEPETAPAEVRVRPILRRKTFVDRVVGRSGQKKGPAKDVIDATLAVLGEALEAGEELNLPPFGKVRLVKEKANGSARVLTVRLVRGGKAMGPEGLAERGDEG